MDKSAQRHESVTLMYVPGEAGKIRRYQIPRVWLRRTSMALGAVFLALVLVGVDYVRARGQLVELENLRAESAEQRAQILDYSHRIADISGRLDRISRLDRKLRVITDLDPADPVPMPGIGGMESSPLEPHQLIRVNREARHRRMEEMLTQLSDATESTTGRLEELIAHLENRTARLSSTPSIAPARGWVTSTFGYRTSPFTEQRQFHRGLDIAGRTRTPIVAPADGEVIVASKKRALGNTITIRHGYGIETIYGHLSEIDVSVGDKVKRGQKIGLMGNTGRSTGPHLHYQVQVEGKPVNPRNYILD